MQVVEWGRDLKIPRLLKMGCLNVRGCEGGGKRDEIGDMFGICNMNMQCAKYLKLKKKKKR